MRQVRFLPVLLLTFLLSSCNDNLSVNNGGEKEQGMLSLELSMDSGSVISKADDSSGGEMTAQDTLDNFRVEIYRKVSDKMSDGILLYRKSYSEARNNLIPLDAGDYYLRAKFGDSLGIGFDRPFLMAEQDFTVRPQTKESVSAKAKIANVKVSVKFGDYFKEYYPNYYVKVINNDKNLIGYKNSVTFEKDEKRSAFIHHGEMTVEVYADFKGDGNWTYYHISGIDSDNDGVISDSEKFSYSPNDHITFDIDAAEKLYGNLLVNIRIDNTTEDKTYTAVVPEYKAPQAAPSVSRQGFDVKVDDQDGYAYVYENRIREYTEGQSFSYNAKAGMTGCTLTVDASELGLEDQTFDLLNETDVNALKEAGIRCSLGQFMVGVDFTDAMKTIGQKVVFVDDKTPCATFSMTVTDEANESSTISGSLLVWPELKGSITIPDYDIWGWKIASPTVTVEKGSGEYCQLQFSADGKTWETIQTSGTVSGNKVVFADITGLEPSTSYWLRAMDGEFEVTDQPVKVTTESPLQLGNPSFEEFRVQTFQFRYKKMIWFGSWTYANRYWYDRFNESSSPSLSQWATNSSASLDYEVTPEYLYYKTYPTVTLQKGNAAKGEFSIMIASVAIDDYGSDVSSGDAKTGEVWIGKADNSGEHKGSHTQDGWSFTSRPSKLTFMHKFSHNANDPYLVTVQVWDAAKNVIGSGSLSSSTSVEPDWTLAEVPVEYTVTNKKAAYIFVSFKSSATGSTGSRQFKGATGLPNTHVEPSGSSYVSKNNDPIHAGSILWVDDINLEYGE